MLRGEVMAMLHYEEMGMLHYEELNMLHDNGMARKCFVCHLTIQNRYHLLLPCLRSRSIVRSYWTI